eukprot:CAMPEP_0206575710 /NCGR_PEP_ID=MMETSP0325_2-20121206/30261_1 /ASSEMBLY_ACC=CAM_ASM_000347 /TAXON_ID=2866 /ORGANISM="Crypthecodinium cohnii, Strain Seligo" /LENGTH=124 /DNA_ID=CAMNT_0054080673 /DNA_START=316 /DNA_END=690 /DNA_ORIENTATION=+
MSATSAFLPFSSQLKKPFMAAMSVALKPPESTASSMTSVRSTKNLTMEAQPDSAASIRAVEPFSSSLQLTFAPFFTQSFTHAKSPKTTAFSNCWSTSGKASTYLLPWNRGLELRASSLFRSTAG